MKKFIFLITLLCSLFTGCTTVEELSFVPRKESLFGIDFSKYSKQGFLITPEKYAGEYQSIGLITYEYLPSAEYKPGTSRPNPYYVPGNPKTSQFIPIKMWITEDVKVEQVMDSVYTRCKILGADALVNFKIEPKTETYSSVVYKNPPIINGYSISGFAIKRK